MVPEATIKSRTAGRVRFAIQARRGDAAYFTKIERVLGESLAYRRIAVSALTGSLVMEDNALELDRVLAVAAERHLFAVPSAVPTVQPMAHRAAVSIRGANRTIQNLSGGVLDLPGTIILALLSYGLWELATGRFRRPPWYTAFWYAFGLFTKTIVDEMNRDAG